MKIDRLDHLVLTVASIEATCEFYTRVLGMDVLTFEGDRKALRFGKQKINLHEVGRERWLRALRATAGSADICFITSVPMAQVVEHLKAQGIAIEAGPGPRSGALGTIESVYFRDPDGNLVEVSNYPAG
ncbi:MAG: VOC family protein [Chloroflexi bacterium]|nr:VOC family protein [Chloroflexota bacterium]